MFKARSSTSSCLHISKSIARLGRRDDIVARKERKILPHVNVQEIKPVFVVQRSLCFEMNNFSPSMVMNVYSMTSKFHHQVFFSTLLHWEFMYLQIYHSKAELGGEIVNRVNRSEEPKP